MDSKVNVLSDIEHEVEVTLTYDEIKPEIDEAYIEERKNFSHPGFRKGKMPMGMLKKLYGEAIEYKASEQIATKKFWDVVEELKLDPISTPSLVDIDFVQGEKLFFKVKYEVKPELKLKDYKGIVVEKPIFKLKEEDVQKEIEQMLKTNATFEEAEKVTDENFKIVVDLLKLDDDGKEIEGPKSENLTIDLTDDRVNEQIKKNAVDKAVGETFNFEFDDEHKHGEEVHKVTYKYSAEIKKIEKIVIPEANEELIKKISNDKLSSLEELESEIRSNFEKYYSDQSDKMYTNELLGKVVENNDFTPPSGYVEVIRKNLLDMEKENAKRNGYPATDEKKLEEMLQPRAEWNAKWQIIMENIVADEKIEITDEEIEKLATEEAEKTGISAEKMKKFYQDSNRKTAMLEEKVIQFLKDNNKVKEIDPEKKAKETKEQK